jgi:hypothetical protein
MTHRVEESNHKGVICLFCGKSTHLPPQVERRLSASPAESAYRPSILRCDLCGKEALYLPEEIVDLQAA